MSRLGQNVSGAETRRENHRIPAAPRMRFHEHNSGQLTYVIDGAVVLHLIENSWIIPANYFLWIPARVQHRGSPIGICDTCFWRGPEKSAPNLPRRPCLLDVSQERVQFLRPFSTERRVSPKDVASLVENAEAVEFPLRYPRTRVMQQIADQFVVAPSTTWNIETCGRQAGMPRRTFTRQFREETGDSLNSWVKKLKCMQARQLLQKRKPVKFISHFLGYRSPSAFIAMFRKEMGCTPGLCGEAEAVSALAGGQSDVHLARASVAQQHAVLAAGEELTSR
jgi:AraC-like DNA-binding protein